MAPDVTDELNESSFEVFLVPGHNSTDVEFMMHVPDTTATAPDKLAAADEAMATQAIKAHEAESSPLFCL